MEKKVAVGLRIDVDANVPHWLQDERKRRALSEIAQAIEKIEGVTSASVVTVEETVCEFCGEKWNVGRNGLNGCCGNDIQEHEADVKKFVSELD